MGRPRTLRPQLRRDSLGAQRSEASELGPAPGEVPTGRTRVLAYGGDLLGSRRRCDICDGMECREWHRQQSAEGPTHCIRYDERGVCGFTGHHGGCELDLFLSHRRPRWHRCARPTPVHTLASDLRSRHCGQLGGCRTFRSGRLRRLSPSPSRPWPIWRASPNLRLNTVVWTTP